jgi:hypothetical protein
MSSPIEPRFAAAAMPAQGNGELPFKLEAVDATPSLYTVRFGDLIVGQVEKLNSGEMTNGNAFVLYVPAKRDYGWSRKLIGHHPTQKEALDSLYRLLQCRAMSLEQITRTLQNMRIPSTIHLAGVTVGRQNRTTFLLGQAKRPVAGLTLAASQLQEMWRQCRF